MRLKYLFITLLSMLLLWSCGSGKHAVVSPGYEVANPDAVLGKKELRELFSSLKSSY